MTEKNKLKAFLIEKAKEVWAEDQMDYHLAKVSAEFKEKFREDYKDHLDEFEKLSDFAKSIPELHLNQDERNKAKIGIRPVEAKATQPISPTLDAQNVSRKTKPMSSRGERTLIDFLKLLSSLPESDLDKVDIPVSVLAKLTKK